MHNTGFLGKCLRRVRNSDTFGEIRTKIEHARTGQWLYDSICFFIFLIFGMLSNSKLGKGDTKKLGF
ncbi:hypothetical protein DCO56_21140 [Sphingobacterium athyrii]|uniref:Uncharacterized protein n=1 Tax=Sphingobacterium athyrii TaxID=2152717 RepID=A0A363NPL2_9SPHI|nr:hypothetical protein DCO56_21140 [Sphingobacterium athyrii]